MTSSNGSDFETRYFDECSQNLNILWDLYMLVEDYPLILVRP